MLSNPTGIRIETELRKLAKSSYWQSVWSVAEKIKINIFRNTTDFTYAQVTFLNYLGFYSHLFIDVALQEVSEIIFENEIYEDAYAYYKRNKEVDKPNMQNIKNESKPQAKSSWVFKRGK